MALRAEDRVRAVGADPAESQGENPVTTPLAMLMIPDPFSQREPFFVERAALVKDKNSVTAFDRVPTRGSSASTDFAQLGIRGSAVGYEDLQRVESRYSGRMIPEQPQC